jgi:hypothetical protein
MDGSRPSAGMIRFRFKGFRTAGLFRSRGLSAPSAGLPSVGGEFGLVADECQIRWQSPRPVLPLRSTPPCAIPG